MPLSLESVILYRKYEVIGRGSERNTLLYNVYISRAWLSDLFNSIADCTFPFEVNVKTDSTPETDPSVKNNRGKHLTQIDF